MMVDNNNIFLAGGDALVYLAGPMHKKYSTTFVWGHPFFNSPPLCKHIYTFRVTVTVLGLFQKIVLNTLAHMYCTI